MAERTEAEVRETMEHYSQTTDLHRHDRISNQTMFDVCKAWLEKKTEERTLWLNQNAAICKDYHSYGDDDVDVEMMALETITDWLMCKWEWVRGEDY